MIGPNCVALTGLELPGNSRLGPNSQIYVPLPPSAGIIGMGHHWLLVANFDFQPYTECRVRRSFS